MFKKLKHLTKEFLIFLVIFSLVCWSVSIPLTNFIKDTKAAGGIELMYFDDGGATHDVYLNSTDTPEAFLKITAYETEGTNTLDSITINLDQAMNCSGSTCTVSPFAITDLADLSATVNSGLSLWLDANGDGNFDSSTDSLLSGTSPPSDWTTPADPCPPPDNTSNTFWQTTFTNLNLNIPATFNERLTVFVVALAKENLNASTLHKFMPFIPYNGINISATDSGASIADMPTETCGWMFMPVTLGDEGSGDNIMYGAPIVISEIQTSGGGGTPAHDEFIELYNRTPGAIDISSWSIQYRNTESDTINKINLGSTLIPANGFYLITNSSGYDYGGTVAGNTEYTSGNMALDTASGTLFLINNQITLTTSNIDTSTSTVDKVAWGTGTNIHPEGTSAPAPPANGSLERKAYPSSTPSTMVNGVDSSRGNSSDTYNNSADFIIRSASDGSDPQNTSSTAETDMVTSADRDIVINEVLYNTSSGNSWIEIYNASSTAIDISEWRLIVFATSSAQTYMVPAGHGASNGNLAAGSFIVVHWNSSESPDTDTNLYADMGVDMSVYGGDITLDDGSYIYDYIQFGGSGKGGEAAAVSAGKWTTGDYIYNSNYNESIARQGTAGDDYNSSVDWMYMSSPTQGYPNTGGDSTAPSEVTNVILTDSDNTNYGLDGYDVRVTWSPANAQDSSFDRYELYVLPESVSLDASQHSAYAMLYGQYYYESGTASTSYVFTGYSDFTMTMDSAGTTLSCGCNYRAYVVAVDFSGNRSSAVGSASAILTNDNVGTDTNPPMIDHMGVWQAREGDAITLYARIGDDRDMCSVATAELAYKINTAAWGNATSTCSAPAMSENTCLKVCSIAWDAVDASWDDTTTLYYYLRAADTADNWTYVGMYPTNSESEAQNNPVDIDFVAAATWDSDDGIADITGTIYNESGGFVQDAFVIIDGVATSTATTTSAGIFTFPDNTLYNTWQYIRVIKDGYMEMSRDVERNSSNVNFYLTSGYMSAGAGGSAGSNGIAWTGPMDGMMMAPTDISCTGDCSGNCSTANEMPIMVGFFNQMDANTIDDADASNSGSHIYLTTDGNTKVSGIKVKYVNSDGMNEARIYSSTELSHSTFYTVVITPGVNDTNGNPIEANRDTGNYEFSFSTMPDGATMWTTDYGSFGGGGMFMPPYVVGTNPAPGSYDVPREAALTVEFSEAMDPASIASSITLYPTVSGTTVSLDSTTKRIATISHTSALAASTWYEIRVSASAKNQLGTWLGDPISYGCTSNADTCLANHTYYTSSIKTAATSDTTAPVITASYPANNTGITSGTTPVDVAMSSIEIGFSEAMDPSTINSQSITFKKGTVSTAGTINYDPMSNSAKFIPTGALTANSVYTLTASTSITDLSSNALNISSGNNIISFKTGSADTSDPQILYANGDDYSIAITFSEPMNAALQTDATNWLTSVLNIDNYVTKYGTSGTDQSTWSPNGTCNENATITYDQETNTVLIKGLGTPDVFENPGWYTGKDYYINLTPGASGGCHTVGTGVTDKSGNTIADGFRTFQMPIQSSASTYVLGPMEYDPTMDMGTMGMFGAGAFPMNAMAGQSSSYMIDIPLVRALQDGMQIVITFPTGFDVSAVAPDPYSPMNNDMNEWNSGIVTFDTAWGTGVGGIASTSKNIITMQLDVSGTVNSSAGYDGFTDFLALDLKGIVNSSIPKDFGTSGYTVDIKTKTSAGVLLESITTMPFFISEGGTNTLTVVVTAADAGTIASTTSVFLGSPMTGPMEAVSTTFDSDYATSTFTNLPKGDFMLFTNPYITIGAINYLGKSMPEHIHLSGDLTKAITLEKEGSGSVGTVTVYLQGDYSTGGTADDVDIFANSPSGFRVKTLTNVGSSSPNTALYLTEGDWMMGVGPAMPMGPMAGPPPMPDWMNPQMISIIVGKETATSKDDGAATTANANPVLLNVASTNNFQVGDVVTFATGAAGATTTITSLTVNTSITVTPQANWTTLPSATDTITSIRESSSGDNDGKIFFSVASQELKNIKGFVVDDSGYAIGNAEVYAYQPQGFGGGHATTDTAGKFTLKVGMNGVWTIGAFKPGLPGVQEKSVEVRDESVAGDGNTGTGGADVYLNGTIISDASSNNAGTNPLRLKLKRPLYTISGKVLNASSTAIAYAPVWAYESTTWGHADTMTDASGNYILYVDAGTWTVEADAHGVGWLQYDTSVAITTVSKADINLRPASDLTFHSVIGNIKIDGSNQTFIPLRAVAYDANGYHLGRDYGGSTDSNGDYTLSLPTGYYRIDTWVPGYGEIGLVYDSVVNSSANINVTAATTTADILIATTDLKTISLQFNNGAASQTGFLHIEGITDDTPPKPTGFFFSQNINGLTATSTIKLKTGHYVFFLDVPGLGSYIPTLASRQDNSGDGTHIIVTADRTVYFTLTDLDGSDMITVSGTVKDGLGANLANAWVWLGNPSSHFHTGTESDSNGAFSLTVPAGSYELGADKPGYMPTAPTAISSGSTNNTITLTSISSNSQNITGYVKNSGGTGLANAMVWAEEVGYIGNLGTGKLIHTQADSNGYYTLPVTTGTWSIMANANGYVKSYYKVSNSRTDIIVSATSQSPSGAINFSLTADTAGIKSKSKPITPASGGTLDDTAQDTTSKESSGTGIKLTAPPNALGSSASTGNISAQTTSAVTKTNSSQPFKDQGVTVAATDNSGQAINNLDDNMDMQMVIYKADVDAEITSGNLTYAMLKNTNNGYWDSSLDNWVNLTTTRTAYYKANAGDNEWTLYATSSTNIFETFIDGISDGSITAGDYKLVFNSQTNHLTIFAIIMPFIATPAQAAPSTPADPVVSPDGGGPGAGSTYCTNVEYDQWQNICVNGWQYRNILSQSPNNCALTSEQESQRKRQCGQATETEETISVSADELYLDEAQIIFRAEVNEILPALEKTRNHNAEKQARDILINKLRINMGALEPRHQYALTNFITYGSAGTQRLGSGERAGVINSFRAAFGKLPQTETGWQDVVKIANGRWPNQRSADAEDRAGVNFNKIYLRDYNMANANDNAAITVMAYGLRPASRNLDSEKAAIRIFKDIYGYNPEKATAWDVVRAIAYSGATR